MTRTTKATLPYKTGVHGVNVVSVAHVSDSKGIHVEMKWYDREKENPRQRMWLTDPITKKPVSAAVAIRHADEMAEQLKQRIEMQKSDVWTMHRLIRDYQKVSHAHPEYGQGTKDHDFKCARMFTKFLPADLLASDMGREQWDGFIAARKRGGLVVPHKRDGYPPMTLKPVKARQAEYDLKYLIKVLRYGVAKKVLAGSPFAPEHRKNPDAPWTPMPKEKAPRRVAMTEELRALLIGYHAPRGGPDAWQFPLALRLQYLTWSRNIAVRDLRWADVNFRRWTILWRGLKGHPDEENAFDQPVYDLLKEAPSRFGSEWVFPAPRNAELPTSKDTFDNWLKRAKARALKAEKDPSVRADLAKELKGVGFHSEKRAAVQQQGFRELSPKEREQIARTSNLVLTRDYDTLTHEDQTAALAHVRRVSMKTASRKMPSKMPGGSSLVSRKSK